MADENLISEYNKYQTEMSQSDMQPVFRTQAYNYSNDTSSITLRNTGHNSIYDGYGHQNYSYSNNVNYGVMEHKIFLAMKAYDEEPIVSNIIDLMSEFASQGARIVCADKKQEQFGQKWFEYLGGSERCERFLSILLRGGTTVVKWTDGKVPIKIRKKWKSTSSEIGEDGLPQEVVKIEEIEAPKAVLPLKWTFHDPRQVAVLGGLISTFVGKPIFALRINSQIRAELMNLNRISADNEQMMEFKKMIPDYVFDAVNSSSTFFPLDQTKIAAYYYKKDDWCPWGKPLVSPIIKHLKMLNKLEACDSAAMDGAMSAVRVWTLGDLANGIIPQAPVLNKFRDMLANFVPGGVTDVVWGPDLKLVESKSNLYEWLKPEKYTATLSSIYAGLGVPPGLTGSGGGSSFTNSNISLKTLIERLKYIRTILVQFLKQQLEMVQKAMGYTKEFDVVFDQMVLSDEAAEKALFLQLWDRDLISDEAIRYVFDLDNQGIEEAKINRTNRRRGKSLPNKASPYHNPDKEHELRKLAIQKSNTLPSQVGLDLLPAKPGEDKELNPPDMAGPTNKFKPKGSPMTGRPVNSKDTVIRKQKRVLPRGSSAEYSDLFRFAESAQDKVEQLVNPIFISFAEKKNLRSLSNEETSTLEHLKLSILSNIQPYSEINLEHIQSVCTSQSKIDEEFYTSYSQNVYKLMTKYGRELTISEKRNIICETYAELFS